MKLREFLFWLAVAFPIAFMLALPTFIQVAQDASAR